MDLKKTCPYCAEEIRPEAIKCRYCGSHLVARSLTGEWTRKNNGRMLGGVCCGLAERFDISVTVIRLAFALSFILGAGFSMVLYVILWLVMPVEDDTPLLDDSEWDGRPPPL